MKDGEKTHSASKVAGCSWTQNGPLQLGMQASPRLVVQLPENLSEQIHVLLSPPLQAARYAFV